MKIVQINEPFYHHVLIGTHAERLALASPFPYLYDEFIETDNSVRYLWTGTQWELIVPNATTSNGSQLVSSLTVLDNANSTTSPLLANNTFTGAWVSVTSYNEISVLAFADQASAVNGLQIQFSTDGTNVDHIHSYSTVANVGKQVKVDDHALFYRIVFINGAVNQTAFRLQSLLHPFSSVGSIVEANDIITAEDDCLLTKSVITGLSVNNTGFKNVITTGDGSLMINQNTTVDSLSSSTSNLAVGASFVGPAISDLYFTAVQYTLKTDQLCNVFVEQSPDGTNWDISDPYQAFPNLGSGNTVQLVASFYRIRVTNIGVATTTFFRLQVIQIPFLPSLPRTLDSSGNLQVAIKATQDSNNFISQSSPNGELLAVPTYRLIGSTFPDSTLDTVFWTASLGTGGTAAPVNGQLVITTGTTANNSVNVVSTGTARYVIGQMNKFRAKVQLPDPGTANNTRRIGVFTVNDGAFFEVSGTLVSLVTRKNGVETARVPNGSFNGKVGSTVPTGSTLEHLYEIIYNLQFVYFLVDGIVSHTMKFNAAWSSTLDLPIRIENFNSNGSTTNVTLNVLGAAVLKYGIAQTQPVSDFQQGLTAGRQLKIGAGNMQGVVLSGITNNSVVTYYDGLSTAGRVIWTSGPLTSNGLPFEIDLKGIAFSTGLFIAITGAALNTLTMYE